MTATDELRRMLDERGIEHFDNNDKTLWGRIDSDYYPYGATENFGGSLNVHTHAYDLTPAQAIAVTLGDAPRLPYFWTADGTLHIELPKLPESISVRLPEQRDREVYSARVRQYTRDNGTCHAIVSDNLTESEGMGDAWADCSECGHLLFVLTDPNSEPPNFCPNCGARVVELEVVDE